MRNTRLKLFAAYMILLCMLAAPTFAQDGTLGPGEGAPIVETNFGGDISTLNPILIADGSSQDVADHLFPELIGNDPDSGLPVEDGYYALAESWEVSDDGLVYTFKISEDWTWSDGTPITAEDIKYAYDAITSGDVDSRLISAVEDVESMEAPDPYTLIVTFRTPSCAAILTLDGLQAVPAHKYQEVYPTFADMTTDSDYNLAPEVTSGPFKFANFRPGEQVTLLADQNFTDAQLGYVVPEGWVYKQVADQTVAVEQFLAGDVSLIDSVPDDREAELKELGAAGEIDYREAPSASWHYIYFNLADPENPVDGQDENGNPIDQGHHPIFGDVRVRQAFAMSINHEELNAGAFNGGGTAIGSFMLPQSWAFDGDSAPAWPYDPDAAMALLDEAGFVDDDGDASTPRVATEDALYAEPGTPLEFDFTTFTGNTTIDATAVLIQDQVGRTGFRMNLDIIEFQAMLDKLLGQNFDTLMVFIGPFDPNNPNDALEILDPSGDVVGAGVNAGSYYNEHFSEIMAEARDLPGCDPAERFELYKEAQAIIREDLPVYFVTNSTVPYVAQADIENYDPRANSIRWNISMWSQQPR